MSRALALIVSLSLSAPAFADLSPDVKKYLGSAAALFEKLEYEKALSQLKRAKAKSQGPEDDLKIALYEGMVLAEMGDANAPAVFTAALGMDPTITLPLVVSPKVQKVFDKAKGQVQKVLDAQAALDRQKAEEKRKQDEANKPQPVEVKPEPAVVVTEPKPAPSSGGLRRLAWVPAAVGVIGVGVGTVLLVQANSAHQKLVSLQPTSREEAQAVASSGSTMQTAGWVMVGVGVAAVAAAAAMFVLGSSSEGSASVIVAPSPDGVFAGVSLRLP